MLENAIYSVISPEGCATILWRDPKKTLEAATAMKLSSEDLLNLKIIDEIIPEPLGGAHRDKNLILDTIKSSIEKSLNEFNFLSRDEVYSKRKEKFLSIGRTKGFTPGSSIKDSLSLQTSFFSDLLNKLRRYKNYVLIGGILFVVILAILFI